MKSPIFSTYSTGENRVTASTLAVFERVDLTLVQQLLESASGAESELTTIEFRNQVSGPDSVPDASISANFTWYFETKVTQGVYAKTGPGSEQLVRHLKGRGDNFTLFALTPDVSMPAWFNTQEALSHPQIQWISFSGIAKAINALLADATLLLPEQTKFLLSELTSMYDAEGLLRFNDTVVVAAQLAWDEYKNFVCYICRMDRSFRPGVEYLGFYRKGQIEASIPKILGRYEPAVTFNQASADKLRAEGNPEVADVVERVMKAGARPTDVPHGVFALATPDSPETVQLGQPIENDTVASSGRRWAWTLGQRYAQLALLKTARKTSDLSGGS